MPTQLNKAILALKLNKIFCIGLFLYYAWYSFFVEHVYLGSDKAPGLILGMLVIPFLFLFITFVINGLRKQWKTAWIAAFVLAILSIAIGIITFNAFSLCIIKGHWWLKSLFCAMMILYFPVSGVVGLYSLINKDVFHAFFGET